MTQRYGAVTLQIKQLSDLSNIGGTYTIITNPTGKQVISGVGSGSFTFPRNSALYSAVTTNIGQVAYVYQTDQVASGAAMDIATFIMEKVITTTTPNGMMCTVSGAGLEDQLTYENASDGAIDNGSGGESSTDIDDIMDYAPSGWSYTTTGTGSSTRSSTGSYHASRGDNVFELLIAASKRSGDIFRLSAYSPPAKTVAWLATPDSSGVTLRMPATPTTYDGSTTVGIIFSLVEESDVKERITGIRPYGAGLGGGRLDITGISSSDTGADPSGYTTTFASNLIVNTTLESSLGYPKRVDMDLSHIQANEPTNATQLTTAAVQIWNEAIKTLQERDSSKKFYRITCNVAADLRPGQTVSVVYAEYEGGVTGGSAILNINDSFTIQEVTNTVNDNNVRITTLVVADTIHKQMTGPRMMAKAVDTARKTTRKSDALTTPGAVTTGRSLIATQPIRIDGGGSADLSADRTFSINGLTTVGAANRIPGVNSTASAWEYKELTEGAGITITHGSGSIDIANSSPASALSGLAFVTIGNTGSLSAERSLTAGDGIDLTDGGANGNATVAVDVTDILGNGLTESSNNIVLGTPGTLTSTSTNSVSASSHTHAVDATIALAADLHDAVTMGSDTASLFSIGAGQILNFDSQTANTVLAGPTSGGAADPTMRALVSADLPTGSTLTVSSSNSGTSHAITSSNAVSSSTATLLATDSNGRLRVQGLGIGTAATGTGVLDVSSTIYINETADGNVTTGLVLNQGAADDIAVSFKSNDVSQGATDRAEADNWGYIKKFVALGSEGGLLLEGLTEGNRGIGIIGTVTSEDTTRSTAAVGAVEVRGHTISGTGVANMGTNANILVVKNNAGTQFLVDAEGDIHMNATSNINAWDDENDLDLINALRGSLVPQLRERYGDMVRQMRPILEAGKIATFNDGDDGDGSIFLNIPNALLLTMDGLRQMHERFDGRLAAIERRLLDA